LNTDGEPYTYDIAGLMREGQDREVVLMGLLKRLVKRVRWPG
jgi:hypothetical protein